VRDHAILQVFTMMMEEPVFDTLRTREQLGYSVFNTLRLPLFNSRS
jgi:secreted Zn-dependent insulinase-like peptidase